MKIVIATPILFDSTSPFNHLFRDILEGLLKKGHSVTRIAAVEREEDTDYAMGLSTEDIPVKRKAAAHGNIITRYLNDSLTALAMARRLRKLDGDVLFEDACYASHFTVRAAKRRGMQVVTMLQDVWPDNAVQSGLLREGSLLYRFFEHFQRYVYRNSHRLICISHDMKAFLVSKGVPEEKITVIYNWGYTDETVDIPWEENAFVKKYDLSEDVFYPIYAGNIGRMQNVELVLRAAQRLRDRQDIRFLIIGAGARKDAIVKMAEEMQLSNVEFLPFQPSELATSIYSAAGVNLIPLVPGGVKTALPSKTGVVLSCGRPAIFAFGRDCAFTAMLDGTGCACVDPSEPAELAEQIARQADCRAADVQSVYDLFTEHFTRGKNIARYVAVISGEQ